MNSIVWIANSALVIILATLAVAKWSVFHMAKEVNRKSPPANYISLKWWPNYKDRRVMRVYHSEFPKSRFYLIYPACLAVVGITLFVAIFISSRSQ